MVFLAFRASLVELVVPTPAILVPSLQSVFRAIRSHSRVEGTIQTGDKVHFSTIRVTDMAM
jgi:hypothetical protein